MDRFSEYEIGELERAELGQTGRRDTFVLILWTAVAVPCFYFALQYGPLDNQYIRIGLWLGVVLGIILILRTFFAILREYKLNLLTSPSTWMMLLTAVLAVFLFNRISEHFPGGFTNPDMLMLAGILVFSVWSLISNIVRTNVIFGVILTVI